jgi:predicted protein tyrosine phosphatase
LIRQNKSNQEQLEKNQVIFKISEKSHRKQINKNNGASNKKKIGLNLKD